MRFHRLKPKGMRSDGRNQDQRSSSFLPASDGRHPGVCGARGARLRRPRLRNCAGVVFAQMEEIKMTASMRPAKWVNSGESANG